jgi:PPM family protein phosphatase
VGGLLRIEVAGETNVGMKRTHNEDNFSIIEESGLYIVADGMGGHASGEIASKMAVEALREFFVATASDPERTWPYKMDRSKGYEENRLITGIKLANLRIFESAQREPRQRGMGTTIVALFAVEDGVYLAHVGDSRVYRARDAKLEQLTEDHSLLNDYVKMKRLTPEEIANFPHKNVIVRALGMKDTVKVDTRLEQPRAGDMYLLCSDGLSGTVPEGEMLTILVGTHDLRTAASRLIARANENGGPDNITVVLARWVPG